jgi:hypothetical protein
MSNQQKPLIGLDTASMEVIYNTLMEHIEPELVTDVLPYLDEWYKNETPEQNAARLERYKSAFATYEQCFGDALMSWKDQYQLMQDKVMTGKQMESDDVDADALKKLSDSFDQA